MEITAKLNYLRIAPRKVRLVVNLIRGLPVGEAEKQLKFLNKKASRPVLKLLNSAIANAKHNFHLDKEGLYISKILVNEGPPLRRSRPRAMGRAFPIMKRTSHIILALGQREGVKEPKQKKAKKAKAEGKPELTATVVKEREEKKEIVKKDKLSPKRRQVFRPKRKFLDSRALSRVKKIFSRKSM